MSISFNTRRICRKAGGLFIGARLQFPFSINDSEDYLDHVATNTTYSASILSIGLLFWQIDIELKHNIKAITET
jgi:hypothetical protein